MLSIRRLAPLLLALFLALPAFAGTTLTGKPKLSFHAVGHPGFLTFDGVTRTLTYEDQGEHLVFTVPMNTVKTGIALRDSHMLKNYLQVDQYPEVVLKVKRADVTWPEATNESSTGTFTAPFTAHGQTRDVEVKYTLKRVKTGWKIDAEFVFDLLAHGVEEPAYMGTRFETDMRATVALELLDDSF